MKKKLIDTFKIDLFKLQNKVYNFEFEGNNDFFSELEQDLVQKGKFKLDLILDKSETMIQALFRIKGELELICDRSLEAFSFPIDISKKIIYKFGDHNEELSDELYLIDRNTQQLAIAQDVFEFIGLEIPIKRLHPRFIEEIEEDDELFPEEEGILVYSTGGDSEEELPKEQTEEFIDPRWAALKNIKLDNNIN